MSPTPIGDPEDGKCHPYERGATRVTRAEIVREGDKLVPVLIWDNGDKTPESWSATGDSEVETAWWAFALDDANSRDDREKAILALIAIAHESHRYDCADCSEL